MRVGFYQFSPEFGAPDANRERIASVLADTEADLVVFPELATSGYLFTSKEELAEAAEPIPGPTTGLLQRVAEEREVFAVVGLPERDGERFYNSAVLVGPGGVLTRYRKAHLFFEEKLYFQPGNTPFPLCEVRGVTIGLLICYDHMFPEAARTLALQGAQVIAHPSNLVMPGRGQLTTRVRAMENRVFWVLANRWGVEERGAKKLRYTGESHVVSPEGAVLAKAPAEGDALEVVEIDPAQTLDKRVTKLNDLFEDRRPDLYRV